MTDSNKTKYLIYKGLYWNHPTDFEVGTLEQIQAKHIEKERKMMQKPGTLNFLANENTFKHKELVTFLENNLGEKIDFRLNDEPFILSNYELKKTLTIQNAQDILKISGFGIYKIIELTKEFEGKYLVIISEDYGFTSESGNFEKYIFSNQVEAEIGVAKYVFHQISNLHANFVRIKEDESKTSQFKSFINGLEFFEFFEGYSVIQPKKGVIPKIDLYNTDEIIKIKFEIDEILKYTNSKSYEIIQI